MSEHKLPVQDMVPSPEGTEIKKVQEEQAVNEKAPEKQAVAKESEKNEQKGLLSKKKPQKPQEEKGPRRNKFAGKEKKRLPRWIPRVVILAAVAAGVGGLAVLFPRLLHKEKNEEIATGMVSRGSLVQSVSGYGTVRPLKEAKYGDKARGKVTEVFVQPGDKVQPGDVLFTVDPSELMDELKNAQEEVAAAQGRVKEAQQALSSLTTAAPFQGKLVGAPILRAGQQVSQGMSLGKLIDDRTLTLAAYYSYAYENQITSGMRALVSLPDSMAQVEGTVQSVDHIRKVQDGAVLFRANITIQNPGTLAAGTVAAASIPTAQGEIMPAETGTLQNAREEEITLQGEGKVTASSLMDYGEYAAGQTLVRLENPSLHTAIENAQKAYDLAAKKAAQLEADLGSREVRTEIGGMVSSVSVQVGDNLTAAGTPLVAVSDTSSFLVEASIDELDISKVSLGMPATVTTGEGTQSENTLSGTLIEVAMEAKVGEGSTAATFPAKIALENDGKLLPNMSVSYKINTTLVEDALLIPSQGVIYQNGGVCAFVREEPGKEYPNRAQDVPKDTVPKGFVPVTIEIGIADDKNTQVLDGLSEGEEIYMTSQPQEEEEEMEGMAFGAAAPFAWRR